VVALPWARHRARHSSMFEDLRLPWNRGGRHYEE
jgi:hypothetical protein